GLLLLTCLSVLTANGQISNDKYVPPDPYGITGSKQHFSKYLIVSPAYFGPNAIPVPRLFDGETSQKMQFDMEYEYYFGDGTQTHDVYTEIHVPVADGKVSLDFMYVPYEFYSVDSLTSREWRSLSGNALNGSSFGDVYFGTHVQLVRDHVWIPDLSFGMSCRTASGTNLEDVRHTDTPGYYLDLSMGKTYYFGESSSGIRWYALVGFYVWQTYLDHYPQDDALLYGGGVQLIFRDFFWENSLRGYSGYMSNGDQPLVYRTELGIREGAAALVLGYEKGIRDYPFDCIRLGIRINGINER
ncbi:MAG: hypothetical protein J7L96_07090, partial [Bacteroidales bacterium]|nr:hypothetical protein [Bacteroidales bacterium]